MRPCLLTSLLKLSTKLSRSLFMAPYHLASLLALVTSLFKWGTTTINEHDIFTYYKNSTNLNRLACTIKSLIE
jgi:hypothetical protein